MPITSTNTITTDINFAVSETQGDNTQRSESDSLGYSLSFSQGTGVGEVNAQIKNTGLIPSGSFLRLDFEAIPKNTFGSSYNINFSRIKGFIFYNQGTGINDILFIRATGSNALSGIFNNTTGNLAIKPYGSYSYIDYYGDLISNTSNRFLYIHNTSPQSGGIQYSYITIGVTG